MNVAIRKIPLSQSCGNKMNFRATWQTAIASGSGHDLQKLRLELAPSILKPITSTHRTNNNDRSINIVRPSYLPVSP
jgi:hypothetical protein